MAETNNTVATETPAKSRGAGWAFLILLCALLSRVGIVYFWDHVPANTHHDTEHYIHIAESVAQGKGYAHAWTQTVPTAKRPPGYTLLVAAAMRVFGKASEDGREPVKGWIEGVSYLTALRYFQAGLGVLTVWMVILIGTQLFSRRIGLWAGVVAAFNPHLLYYTGHILSEVTTAFLITACFWGLLRAFGEEREGGRIRWSRLALAGIAAGLLVLARTEYFYFLLGLLPWFLYQTRRTWQTRLVAWICFVGIAMTLLSPWLIRNYFIWGTPFNLGHAAYVLRDAAKPLYWDIEALKTPELVAQNAEYERFVAEGKPIQFPDENAWNTFISGKAVTWMKNHPEQLWRQMPDRFCQTWKLQPGLGAQEHIEAKSGSLAYQLSCWAFTLYMAPLIILFGLALLFLQKGFKAWSLFYWLAFFITGVHLVMPSLVRYRYPIEPFIGLMAVALIGRILKARSAKNDLSEGKA